MSRLLISSMIVTALIAGVSPVLWAAGPAGDARLLAAGNGEVRFRVDFEAPTWVEESAGDAVYRYPQWLGLAAEGEPGAPALPIRRVRVAVPPTGELRLDTEFAERGSAAGVRFPPVPRLEEIESFPGRRDQVTPQWIRNEGPGYARAGALPQVEILAVGIERGVRVATVAVRPARWDPASGQATWSSSVTVSVRAEGFAGRDLTRAAPGRARPDPTAQADWRTTLINPDDAPFLRGAEEEIPAAPDFESLSWFNDAAGWAKIQIKANGVYKLDRAALAAAGVPVDEVDPRTLRLFSGPLVPELAWTTLGWRDVSGGLGISLISEWRHVYETAAFTAGFTGGGFEEIAVEIAGAADGKLDAADRIVFYALGPDNYRDRFGLPLNTAEDYFLNPYSDHTVYWLAWGGDLPGTPRRMESLDATPHAIPETATRGRTRLHVERNTIYDPSMYQGGLRWEEWFWEFLESGSLGQQIPVDLPHVVDGSSLDAHIRLWGAQVPLQNAVGEEASHHVQVSVNGESVGLFTWGGSSTTNAFTPQDVEAADLPAQPRSFFNFTVPEVGTNPKRYDRVYLTWIDVDYLRAFDAAAAPVELRVDPGMSAERTVRVANPPAGSLLVYDVTDFRSPRRLSGAQSLSEGGVTAAEFAALTMDGFVVALTAEAKLLAPASVAVDTPPRLRPRTGEVSWLRDVSEPVDYVIVAGDELANEAEILAAWRRNHLPPLTDTREARVRVVRVSDIMDEFAWGMWDPIALRYFLEYAYRYYGGTEDAPLSYVVFLGDHTYDFRDYERTGVADLVPSWEDNRNPISGIVHGNVQYASDDPLARFDGPLDIITDLYLGRIPVQSKAEAQAVLEGKVIRSEQNPQYGPWRTKAILIADDRCQGREPDNLGSAHAPQSEAVDALIPGVFDRDKIYLFEYGEECIYDSKPDAKRALLDSWSEGAWLVNYIGHGGDAVLADEHVLDLADTPLLANDRRLPVFGAFSCSVGKFSKPTQQGLAEALLREPGSGALVSAAATHLTYSGTNSTLNNRFIEQLFGAGSPTDPVPIGVALMRAKRLVTNDNDKYVCLGDPASRVNVPGLDLAMSGPDHLERGATVSARAQLAGGGLRNGMLDVVARDARLYRDKDSQGRPLFNMAYHLPGAVLFRGQSAVAADTAAVAFTVPLSLRGGPDGKVRAYGWGQDWDAVGALTELPVTLQTAAITDTLGPVITFSLDGDLVSGGEEIVVTLEDPAGINLTRIFDFLAVSLKIFDADGLEQLRQDLTDRFEYETGSHTRGSLSFVVPELAPGAYTFLVTATDNYNNRTQAALEITVLAGSAQLRFEDVFAYPNPFDPGVEPHRTRLMFTLNRPAEVTVRVYSVSGRLVRKAQMEASVGANRFDWDGRDEAGDQVANGVYLVQLTAKGTRGGGSPRHLERVVVLR